MALWFGYKCGNSKRGMALLPELKTSDAMFVDVRSAAEFASGTRSSMAKMMLMKNGYPNVYNVGTWGKLLN